eukprot:scaffold15906_cov92-Skeletonema_dohrnii-CCMP3373.AAC.2
MKSRKEINKQNYQRKRDSIKAKCKATYSPAQRKLQHHTTYSPAQRKRYYNPAQRNLEHKATYSPAQRKLAYIQQKSQRQAYLHTIVANPRGKLHSHLSSKPSHCTYVGISSEAGKFSGPRRIRPSKLQFSS